MRAGKREAWRLYASLFRTLMSFSGSFHMASICFLLIGIRVTDDVCAYYAILSYDDDEVTKGERKSRGRGALR